MNPWIKPKYVTIGFTGIKLLNWKLLSEVELLFKGSILKFLRLILCSGHHRELTNLHQPGFPVSDMAQGIPFIMAVKLPFMKYSPLEFMHPKLYSTPTLW